MRICYGRFGSFPGMKIWCERVLTIADSFNTTQFPAESEPRVANGIRNLRVLLEAVDRRATSLTLPSSTLAHTHRGGAVM